MMRINIYAAFLVVTLVAVHAQGQDGGSFTLERAISLARDKSLGAQIAANTIKTSYWDYKRYKASFLPKLSLNGTIPNYYRSINRIILPTGENSFVSQNIANSNLNLAISQNIGFTGGTISMSSYLERIDNYNSQEQVSFSSAPFLFSYRQNTIFYNDYRWQRRIEPLKYEEAKREYRERMEDIAFQTVDLYFTLLMAQIQVKLDRQNVQNFDTLLTMIKARATHGSADMTALAQTRLSFFNAKRSLANATLQLEVARQNFVRYLKLDKHDSLHLQSPDEIVQFAIDPEEALVYARRNRKAVIAFQRRRIEAEQLIARTRSETGPSVGFNTNFGLTQTGNTLSSTYASPLNRQSVEINFYVPILDWGVNKSNRKRAESFLELEKSNIEQEELEIEQEIFLQTAKWKMILEQMEMVRETSAIALENYEVTVRRYSLGTVSLMDLNQAQWEKDRSIMDYLGNLKGYWSSYYLLRKLTLFDFMTGTSVIKLNE